MKKFVLDAWAVLALLQKEEPAASRVRQLLEEAQGNGITLFLSSINLGEVYYRVGRAKGENEAQRTVDELNGLLLSVLPATNERVLSAARLKVRYPISYADAFAAAAAVEMEAVLVTGDPELLNLGDVVALERLHRQKR